MSVILTLAGCQNSCRSLYVRAHAHLHFASIYVCTHPLLHAELFWRYFFDWLHSCDCSLQLWLSTVSCHCKYSVLTNPAAFIHRGQTSEHHGLSYQTDVLFLHGTTWGFHQGFRASKEVLKNAILDCGSVSKFCPPRGLKRSLSVADALSKHGDGGWWKREPSRQETDEFSSLYFRLTSTACALAVWLLLSFRYCVELFFMVLFQFHV